MGPTFDSGIPRMSGMQEEKDNDKHVLKLDVNEALIQNRFGLNFKFIFIEFD